jgi:hypothetical protein
MDFDDVHGGPFVVLSDGYSFDYVDDCELSYVNKAGFAELKRQNGNNIVGGCFDSVEIENTYSVRLSEIIKFYFENNPNLDPMK